MSPKPGSAALRAFLRRRARLAGHVVALEEALLAGRFATYAARRLAAFGLSRGIGVFLHLIELTWLYDVFGPRAFVASLALQNTSIVVDALWWGALEAQRRRARELGPGSEAATLTTRWLTAATWLALAATAAPIVAAMWAWHRDGTAPTMLHAYAFACGLRLAADLVVRTYYSGVFAFGRVHRPVWSVLVGPLVLVGGTLVLFEPLGGWSFVVALLASALLTRGLLVAFTRRAYRRRRLPQPRLRLRPRRSPLAGVAWRDAATAAVANVSTRLGAVVLLAAIVPSLGGTPGAEDEASVEPFAFALHAAAPLLLLTAQWALVFYHDWKRVEDEAAASLARHLHRRLVVTAAVLAVVAWAIAAAIVLVFVPYDDARATLAALLFAMTGLSVWTALQLRTFARGEHVAQAASGIALLLAVWAVLAAPIVGRTSWFLALAGAPWAAVALHALLARVRSAAATGEIATIGGWLRALGAVRGDVVIWHADVVVSGARVAPHVARVLGARGAVVRSGKRLVWFEQVDPVAGASTRGDWIRTAAGQLVTLGSVAVARGDDAEEILARYGVIGRPEPKALEELRATYARLFPSGFVVEIGRAPPARFRALPPATRQAVWRDAIRAGRGARGRSGWYVTTYAPAGAAEALFVAPRPVSPETSSAWRAALDRVAHKVASPNGRRRNG